MTTGLAAHKLDLARELLDDIELSRLAPEQLLLKATRLARLLDAKEVQKWLQFELEGYPGNDPMDRPAQEPGVLAAPRAARRVHPRDAPGD